MFRYLLHLPLHLLWNTFCCSHTGVTILHFENGPEGITAPRCLAFCDLSHLYGEHLPMVYDNIYSL